MRQLWKMGIHDKKLLAIIHAMLKAPIILYDGTKIYPELGTPQGAVLSPLLSLIVLNDLDWWIANQWEEHPFTKGVKYPSDKWKMLRKQKLREVHIVRYADDFKLFCQTKEDAEAILDSTSEWLRENLKLETSPEKSGVTDLKRDYTEFLGFELKVIYRGDSISPKASAKKRVWTTTSRVKRKALSRLKQDMRENAGKLVAVSESNAKAVIDRYNSVVDGKQNYYSMATQINKDFGQIQKGLRVRMYHKIKGLKTKPPDEYVPSKADQKFMNSKQVRFLHGHMVHPIGYVQCRNAQMPKRDVCNFTESGRALLKIKLGAPEAILTILARYCPPSMPIEEADNRISAYSAQKGKCSVLGIPLVPGSVVVLHKDPHRGKEVNRYHNLTLVSLEASRVINESDPSVARSLLAGLNVDKKAIKTINTYRTNRNLTTL